ncbi:MAG TPA: hypothetical protein VH208_09970 [Myxococcaceae bacterium]|nr:hypothetical protein [Myxococcaceae bacterium]
MRAFVLLLLLCGCSRPWMRDESVRIEDSMRYEAYSAATPGADGIVLGADAPPLAAVAVAPQPSRFVVPGLGYLPPYGRHSHPGFGRVSVPKGPTILR